MVSNALIDLSHSRSQESRPRNARAAGASAGWTAAANTSAKRMCGVGPGKGAASASGSQQGGVAASQRPGLLHLAPCSVPIISHTYCQLEKSRLWPLEMPGNLCISHSDKPKAVTGRVGRVSSCCHGLGRLKWPIRFPVCSCPASLAQHCGALWALATPSLTCSLHARAKSPAAPPECWMNHKCLTEGLMRPHCNWERSGETR